MKNFLRTLFLFIFVCSALFSSNENLLEKAQKIMPNTKIKDAIASGVGDLIAVLLGNDTLVYVDDKTKTIFFGEIYSQYGESLTKLHKEQLGVKSEKLSMKVVLKEYSIKIKTDKKADYGVIVFTDPDCPYCQNIEKKLLKKNLEIDYIYYPIDELHPNARKKSISIISNKLNLSVNDATKRLEKGEYFGKQIGVLGTPYMIVYDNKTQTMIGAVAGADEKKLNQIIEKEIK